MTTETIVKYVLREPFDDDVSGGSDTWSVGVIADDASGQRRHHWLAEFVEQGDAELFIAARKQVQSPTPPATERRRET